MATFLQIWFKVIGSPYEEYYHGKDWHRTPQAAYDRAEEMRKAKIKSLKKQIERLEGLNTQMPKLSSEEELLNAPSKR